MCAKVADMEKGLGNNNGIEAGWNPLPGKGKDRQKNGQPEEMQLLSPDLTRSRFKAEIVETKSPVLRKPSPLASPTPGNSNGKGDYNNTNSSMRNSRAGTPTLENVVVSPNDATVRSTILKHLPFNGMSFVYGQTLTGMDGSKLKNKISSKFGRMRKRVVYKNGECNLHHTKISKRNRRYLQDIFTTLVDIQWRFTLLVFVLSFLLSWLAFAMVWWLICFTHGDLDPEHLPGGSEADDWSPCVGNFFGFTSAFLFSIETQHTIGYGSRYTTEACPIAVFVMCVQSILGVMIQAAMVGVVFSKMARPKKRSQTLMFSRYGAICQRDGVLCLIFRVGDMRKSHIISANVRAHLMKRKVTAEGELLPYYHYELKVGVDSDLSEIFFIWPMLVVHKIDKDSPLYGVSAADLADEKFEIILILEGVIESTGATTQARTSYLPSEILWGHRFETLITYKKEVAQYAIDYTLFHHTYEFDTPVCSAKELDELKTYEEEMNSKGIKMIAPYKVGQQVPEQADD